MTSLKRQMATGAAWLVLLKFVERGIGLISTLILARLLVPGDFGLIAMAMGVIAALELLSSFNFETVLIQNHKADRSHYDTAFTLNLLLTLVKAALIALLAWPAAAFYNEPRLLPVMLALAAASAVQAFENVGIVDFQKELRFQREFALSLYRKLAGFFTTLAVAWWLQSYWALIAGITVMRLVSVVLSYTMHPFRPRLNLSRGSELFGYSKWLLLNNVLIVLNNRGADFVIGRVSGAHALGIYTVSYELANLPTTELVFPIQRAVFPGYARLADDLPALRQAFVEVIGLIALLTVPIGLTIGALAEPFVLTLLGAQWRETVPLVQLLAVFGVVRALHGPTGSVYLALAKPRFIALFAVAQLIVALGLMMVLVPMIGPTGAAWSILSGATLAMCLNYAVLLRQLDLTLRRLLTSLWRPMLAGLIMWLALIVLRERWSRESLLGLPVVELLGLGLFGLLVYVTAIAGAWRLAARPPGSESALLAMLRDRLGRTTGSH